MFRDAIFQGNAGFYGASFHGDAGFSGATFQDRAEFDTATFLGDARFDQATFEYKARFEQATFHGDARFDLATFQDDAMLGGTTFQGDARFDQATFQRDASFDQATFQGDARFDDTTFRRLARFRRAVFERAQQLGPLLAYRGLDIDGAQFSQPVGIEASTPDLSCRRARFAGGVQFRLRWARIVLDDTDLSAPSLLTGIPRLASDKLTPAEKRIARAWTRRYAGRISDQPTLLSLRRANVAGLGLGNVNLGDCRFAGAHNLDLLRLDADISLGLSPARAGWERRQVIAEEAAWRAARTRPHRWAAPEWPGWAGEQPAPPSDSAAVAGLYRALRKGREDAKDEPGAADFYYGEMEMRRHANSRAVELEKASRGRVDRGLLFVYWLVSGYALRLAAVRIAGSCLTGLAGIRRTSRSRRGLGGCVPPDWLHHSAAASHVLDEPAVRLPVHHLTQRRRGEAHKLRSLPRGRAAVVRPGTARSGLACPSGPREAVRHWSADETGSRRWSAGDTLTWLPSLKPTARVALVMAINVLYKEGGTEYEMQTHYPILILTGGIKACAGDWSTKYHIKV